jgi:hypothetical protein
MKVGREQATAAADLAIAPNWNDQAFGRVRSQSLATDNSSVDIEMRRDDDEYDDEEGQRTRKRGACEKNRISH